MRLIIKNNNTSFEQLILSLADYNKSRINRHEISLHGNLYDVKSVRITGEAVELIAVNDTREKSLLQDLKDFLHKSSTSKKELPDQLQKFLSLNYLLADKEQVNIIPSSFSHIFPSPDISILANLSDIPSPPPKLGS